MTQKYVLDTSVILSDPHCLESFPNSIVIIQEGVLSELDRAKTDTGEIGKSARVFIRQLDEISEKGNISKGFKTGKNTLVKIDTKVYTSEDFGDPTYVDNKILQCAIREKGSTIVSRDIALRLRARAFGCKSINYQGRGRDISDLYQGFRISENVELGEKLKHSRELDCNLFEELRDLCPNECIHFVDKKDKTIALGREMDGILEFIPGARPWGLGARNIEQAMAIDLLLDPEVPLVSLTGQAGCGKTLIAVAAALESVIKTKVYDRIIIYRPIQPVGADLGYLPGELSEKLDPWMGAIKDSMDLLVSSSFKKGKKRNGRQETWQDHFSSYLDRIHLESITHIRGRSIPNSFIIMDEAQNVSKKDIKTLVTRMGENSKLVLTGDIQQIDHHHLDAIDNGLTSVINAFKNDSLAGHITLLKGERSPLATRAAELL